MELACNTKQNSKKDNMVLIMVDLKKLTEKPLFTPTLKKSLSDFI